MTTFIETVQRENRETLYKIQKDAFFVPLLSDGSADKITTHTITRLIEDIERQLPEEIDTEHCEKCVSLKDGHNTCLAKVREIINQYKQ